MIQEDKKILVKKKDGSFVKMKFSDLKKNKTVEEKKPEDIKKIPIGTWTKEDAKSPLEDEELQKIKHTTFNKRELEAEEIIKKLSFQVAVQAQNNLKNNLVLLLKDIKNERQFKDALQQPVYLGGADLDEKQIKEIIKMVESKRQEISKETPELSFPLKKKGGNINLPMIEDPILPATSSPFNSFVHKPAFNKKIREIKSLDELVEKENSSEDDIASMMKYGKSSQKKVDDIIPPKELTYGPVDEIKNFSLVDFRRLSSKTEEAVERLKQKFINLKEESFLMYLQGLEAWQQSPLYKKYAEKLCEVFNKGISLNELSGKNEDDLKEEEVRWLIKMEKEI